jgi:cytochrome c oxidase subunit 4
MDAVSPEEIRKHVRSYVVVFVTLLCLTLITVGVSYMHLARPAAIALALVIATAKAGLVAAFFMHLISEKKVIYGVPELLNSVSDGRKSTNRKKAKVSASTP